MFKKWSLAVLAAGLLVGCGGGSSSSGQAQFRVVNAIPNLTSANASIGQWIIQSGAGYGTITSYSAVDAGSSQPLFVSDGAGDVLVDSTLNITSGHYYTMLEVGSTTSPEVFTLTEDHSTPASGTIRLSVINASPTQTSADVYVTAADTDLSTVSATVTSLPYKAAQGLNLNAGIYRVRFTKPGTKTVVADVAATGYSDGTMSRLILIDKATGGTPLQVISASDLGG